MIHDTITTPPPYEQGAIAYEFDFAAQLTLVCYRGLIDLDRIVPIYVGCSFSGRAECFKAGALGGPEIFACGYGMEQAFGRVRTNMQGEPVAAMITDPKEDLRPKWIMSPLEAAISFIFIAIVFIDIAFKLMRKTP